MILDYLKQQTSSIHEQVESKNIARFVLDHSITKEQFNKLLLQNLFFYETVERELLLNAKPSNINLTPFINQIKSNRLKKDLEANSYDLSQYQNLSFSLTLNSIEEIIGAIYVNEGSSLGVMLINKHLPKCSNLDDIDKHYFYGADSKETLQQWSHFREIVETHKEVLDKQLVLGSAIRTFVLFNEIMDRVN